jgi:hypothetical protein
MAHESIHLKYRVVGLILLAAAILYLLTLDNGLRPDELTGGDLITHQYAQVEARPSNAPGYPLYTMGGWLWFKIGRFLLGQFLNPVQILSLYSTLWGLASLFILYLILRPIMPFHWSAAGALTAFYAVTYFFWYYSITTEQYTSAVFQTLLIIWLAFRWDALPRHRYLLAMAFVSGTMLANMLTTLFILPPLLWFILFRPGPANDKTLMIWGYLRQPRLIIQATALALLPTLSYAYVYLRGAQHPEWRGSGQWTSSWDWFVQFITIQQGRDELAPGLRLENFFTAEFPALMWQELTWIIFIGGLTGLFFLKRRQATFLYSTLLIYFVFCWGYRFGNWFQVIIPVYPIFIIGFAAAVQHLFDWLARRATPSKKLSIHTITFLITLALIGLVIYRFNASLPRANQRNHPDDTGLQPGWAILADAPSTPAVIAGNFAERVALQYLTIVWNTAANIYPADVSPETDYIARPPDAPPAANLYITRQAAKIAPAIFEQAALFPQAEGEQLISLAEMPRQKISVSAKIVDVNFGSALMLRGWEVTSRTPGQWQATLYWQTNAPIPHNYTISVRPMRQGKLIQTESQPVMQDHPPVWGFYPTNRWQPGEIVQDVYALSLPDAVTPDAFQVVVYRATDSGFENLADSIIQVQ